MRIAIDARELCGRPTGVGRYLAHLLRAWDGLPDACVHEFLLYLPVEAGEPPWPLSELRQLRIATRAVPGGSGSWWEQVRLPAALRRDRPDVLFSPAYSAPAVTRTPVVLTLHDLSFVAHPEWFPPRARIRRRLLTYVSARRARCILTDAEVSRREVVTRLGVDASKVRVVPLGLTRIATRNAGDSRRDPRSSGPVVLFVGSIFNRRHLPELIDAFGVVARRRPNIRLEIVGDDRTYPPQDLAGTARAAGVGDAVRVRSYVTDAELAGLYASADVFVFLSEYEGFGLTPLEALASGTPIIVGDTPVAREVYGEAAVYVEPRDVGGVAAAIDRLLADPSARAAVLGQVPGVLARVLLDPDRRGETLTAIVEAARE